ncbi:hypothetical protein HYQ46_002737 [Verticillium longisporum]|nr:hypothetical protein HYQ46_002737 [Verticillium longisporum]
MGTDFTCGLVNIQPLHHANRPRGGETRMNEPSFCHSTSSQIALSPKTKLTMAWCARSHATQIRLSHPLVPVVKQSITVVPHMSKPSSVGFG